MVISYNVQLDTSVGAYPTGVMSSQTFVVTYQTLPTISHGGLALNWCWVKVSCFCDKGLCLVNLYGGRCDS